MDSFSFRIEKNKLDKIKKINHFNTTSEFINTAIDFYISHLETRFLTDLTFYILFPFLGLIALAGLSIYLAHWFLYILTLILAAYLIILIFLFHYKYKHRRIKK